jgi:hypothetical protein
MQYECTMQCNVSALYVPHQKKRLPNIYSVHIVSGKSHSSLWLVLVEWLTQMWLVYLQKSTIYMTCITTCPPCGTHAFNAAWTTLHTLQDSIHILQKWSQDIPRSPHALGLQLLLVARWTRSPYHTIRTALKQASSWEDGSNIHITQREDTYLLIWM